MTDGLLQTIIDSVGSIATWISVLAGGTVLTYYVLPHVSQKVHGNAITFIWITGLLTVWAFVIQPLYVTPVVTIAGYYLSLLVYPVVPFAMMQSFVDTFYTLLAAWVVKIAFFPDTHHSKI